MKASKRRTAMLSNHGSASIAADLDELRAQVDERYARTRAKIEAEHTAVDAEIAALLARLRLVQLQVGESRAGPLALTG